MVPGRHLLELSLPATYFAPSCIRWWERKFQGAKVPGSKVRGSESSRERKFQGAKVPGSKVRGSESYRERKFRGAKVPGSEWSWERKIQFPLSLTLVGHSYLYK